MLLNLKNRGINMLKVFKVFIVLGLVIALSPNAFAVNGVNLIGVGAVSRTMGGLGVAAPQDAVTAVFANPAAIYGSEAVLSVTILDSDVEGEIDLSGLGMGIANEQSGMKPFFIPAVGITSSITDKLRFGVGAYGVSGMGVDYKDTSPIFNNLFTKLEVMKISPAIAYRFNDNLSAGASLGISYCDLDLGSGSSHDYSSVGAQVGLLYQQGIFRIGASYLSPQKVNHEDVTDLDADGAMDNVTIEAPQSVALGLAVEPFGGLLVGADLKWYNWSDAEGYKDFDWDDQWVFIIGAQYRPIPGLAIRAGFNYGKNPVNEHNGFNPAGATNFQGMMVPTLNLEVLRIVGSPVIVEKHITVGIGYDVSENVAVNAGFAHAFDKTISETSAGGLATLETKSGGDSFEFGIVWEF
jgi:long-chain fatty acid transport protein